MTVVVPAIALGVAGAVPNVIASVLAVPAPQVVLGVTVQVPDVADAYDTVMLFVLLPAVIV